MNKINRFMIFSLSLLIGLSGQNITKIEASDTKSTTIIELRGRTNFKLVPKESNSDEYLSGKKPTEETEPENSKPTIVSETPTVTSPDNSDSGISYETADTPNKPTEEKDTIAVPEIEDEQIILEEDRPIKENTNKDTELGFETIDLNSPFEIDENIIVGWTQEQIDEYIFQLEMQIAKIIDVTVPLTSDIAIYGETGNIISPNINVINNGRALIDFELIGVNVKDSDKISLNLKTRDGKKWTQDSAIINDLKGINKNKVNIGRITRGTTSNMNIDGDFGKVENNTELKVGVVLKVSALVNKETMAMK